MLNEGEFSGFNLCRFSSMSKIMYFHLSFTADIFNLIRLNNFRVHIKSGSIIHEKVQLCTPSAFQEHNSLTSVTESDSQIQSRAEV